jgi:uncharacterized phage-associated protein
MHDINLICDYIINKVKSDEDILLSNLKLQKLLYYVQAWYLAYYDKPIFVGKFEAWVHGPVNRAIYERFKNTKNIYSNISIEDIISNDFTKLQEKDKQFIDEVLEAYMPFSGTELEYMVHNETPWMDARGDLLPTSRCTTEIDDKLITSFYKKRINAENNSATNTE